MRPLRAWRAGVAGSRAQVESYRSDWAHANALAHTAAGPLWVVLGDSAAQGVGASSYDRGYVGQLRERLEARDGLPWQVLNLSRSGARAADVVSEQLRELRALSAPPDLVTCAVGGNDMLHTRMPALLASLHVLVSSLPRGAVLATIPQGLAPWRARRANAEIRRLAPGAGLVVADIWATTGPPWRGKFAPDEFHPNDLGYADWARAFATALHLPE
jgi:lysophospholipase L1-like esterase